MKVLLIGDIVGRGGRRAVKHLVPQLRQEFNCAFCIANGENSAGGSGITANCVREIGGGGVDVITTGDHVWDQRDFVHEIKGLDQVLRPANVDPEQPGRGAAVFRIPIGGEIGVINLVGRVFLRPEHGNPFAVADAAIAELAKRTRTIFVDMHAEATSEKIAMGRYLDGRVTCVFGTHTHVQTADETVFPGGTAFICDLGMVGAERSVLGRDVEAVLTRFTTGMPSRFKVVDKDVVLHGAVVDFDPQTGKARSIQRVVRAYEPK